MPPHEFPPAHSGAFRTTTAWLLVLLLAVVVIGGVFLHAKGDRHGETAKVDTEEAQAGVSSVQSESPRDLTFGLNLPKDTSAIPRTPAMGKAAMARLIYRGRLTPSGDDMSFQPCGTATAVKLRDSLGMLPDDLLRLARASGRSLYCEFHGALVENGTTTDVQTVIFLNDLLYLATEGNCDHLRPVASFVAGGLEPTWNLRINEDTSQFSTPAHSWSFSSGMSPHDAFFSTAHGQTSLRWTNTRQDTEISIRLEKKPCRGTMLDAWSAFSVHLSIGGDTFEGCGRPGRYIPPVAGRYETDLPAASSPGRHLVLLLSDSGFAGLNQDYRNGKPDITREGIWQPSGPSGVEVYFVGQPGHPPSEHMLFTATPTGLQAVQYDRREWGSEGLQLTRVEPDD